MPVVAYWDELTDAELHSSTQDWVPGLRELVIFDADFPAEELQDSAWQVVRVEHETGQNAGVNIYLQRADRPGVLPISVLRRPNFWVVMAQSKPARITAAIIEFELERDEDFDDSTIGAQSRVWLVPKLEGNANEFDLVDAVVEGAIAVTRVRKV